MRPRHFASENMKRYYTEAYERARFNEAEAFCLGKLRMSAELSQYVHVLQ